MATTQPKNNLQSFQELVETVQKLIPPPAPQLPPAPPAVQPWTPAGLLSAVIERPLYTDLKLSTVDEVERLRVHSGKFDMYCPGCKKEATWQVEPTQESQDRKKTSDAAVLGGTLSRATARGQWLGYFQLYARCTRSGHLLCLNMLAGRCENDSDAFEVTKIGQFPTMTDIELGDLREFDDSLPRAIRKEFVKAINCAAHGFSVAACVYYRRIFEGILVEAREEHMKRLGLTDWPEFDRSRTDERIRLLRGDLPDFVVDHPHLYGLLSKGVHELSEKECADEMPILRGAMELVLRDRAAKAKERKQREDVAKLLAQATDRHK